MDGSSGAVEAPVNNPQQGGAQEQDGGDQESSGKQLIVPVKKSHKVQMTSIYFN